MAEKFRDLVDLCERTCTKFATRPLFGTKQNGAWRWTSYAELHDLVARARSGLAGLGVKPGDRVAMITDNCVEWAVSAYATYGLGATFVPMYRAQQPRERAFILEDCGANVAIVQERSMREQLPLVRNVVALDSTGDDGWTALLDRGARVPTPPSAIEPGTIAGFVYTSGTTGRPKGVMQSHGNIVSNINAVHQIFTFDPEDRALSFLPWAHSYGQTCEVHGLFSMGASIAINDRLDHLLDNLAEVQPTVLLAVPRIFNRIYQSVNEQIAAKPHFLQRLVRAGISAAIRRGHGERTSLLDDVELAIDEKVLFAKIRAKFGGNLRFTLSASATLGKDIAEFIDAIGITVYEGYGLTETSPIVAANFPDSRRLGSVGKVLPGVRVVIDQASAPSADGKSGEIVVYGPNVMVGYHNRPEENEKAFTPDGGLRTGDLGHLDEDGFLYVTGRIKEQYKLENGKYVVPSPLEEELKLSPYFTTVMLYGDGKPHNVALVALDRAALNKWAVEEGIVLGDDLARDPSVRALVGRELEVHSKGFRAFERPRAFVMTTDEISTESGFLTPTLKLKRAAMLARYHDQLESLYVAPTVVETSHAV